MGNLPLDTEKIKTIDPDLKKLLSDLINREVKYQALRFYSGQVVDNKDPKQMGRCRIRVFGIYGLDIPDEALPWALPDDHFVGSFIGSMIIPPKDALVRVYFEHGDIYSPIYTSKIPEIGRKSDYISKDYPDQMLFFETDNHDYFMINRAKAEVTFHTGSGVLIRIDRNGNLSLDTTEAAQLYGGGVKLEVNGDVSMKTIGNVTIEGVGPSPVPPMMSPADEPDLLNPQPPKTLSTSKVEQDSTGDISLLSLGVPPTAPDPIPNPKDPIDVQFAAMRKLKPKRSAINIIAQLGDINVIAVAGSVKATAGKDVQVVSPSVKIDAGTVDIGTGILEAVLKSEEFASFFDQHKHPTSNGPSGPPLVPMKPQLETLTSPIVSIA